MNTIDRPVLSVVTVVRNDPTGLCRTAESIVEQGVGDFEWIVIDGDSTDETKDVLETINEQASVVLSEPDSGIFNAMNKGVGLSLGRWINFMNAGDVFAEASVLREVLPILDENDCSIIYGDFEEIFPGGQTRYRRATDVQEIVYGGPTRHQSIFYRRELLDEVPYDESMTVAADWCHLFDAIHGGASTLHLPRAIARFDMSGASQKKWKVCFQEQVQHLQRAGVWTPEVVSRYRYIWFHTLIAKSLESVLPRWLWFKIAESKKRMTSGVQER